MRDFYSTLGKKRGGRVPIMTSLLANTLERVNQKFRTFIQIRMAADQLAEKY
jgi:hypothetical protein